MATFTTDTAYVVPYGATHSSDLEKLFQRTRTALDFGAIPDCVVDPVTGMASGTDNSDAIMAASNKARDERGVAYLTPGKYFCTKPIRFWTTVIAAGVQLIFPNNAATVPNKITITNLPGDFGDVPFADVKSWTGWKRGSTQLGGLTNRAGQYVYVDTNNQYLIDRIDEDDIQFGEGFLVADNAGRLSTPLYGNANNQNWTSAVAKWKQVRGELRVEGLTVVLAADASNFGTGRAFYNDRPNVKYVGVEVINLSTISANEYFKDVGVCKVSYENCKVRGSARVLEAYGWNSDLSAILSYVDCEAQFVRRGIDAHRTKLAEIVRPILPDGWGAHYAWWMGSRGGSIGATYSGNPQAVNVAGGGFWCAGAVISVGDDANCALRIRPDTAEAGGAILFASNRVEMRNGGELVDIEGPDNGSKVGRVLEWPRSVSIEGNSVRLGGAADTTLRVLTFGKCWTATESPHAMDVSGHLRIAGNKWEFETGGPLLASGAPRLKIEYNKAAKAIGDGLSAYIADFPALQITTMVEAGGKSTTAARFSATVERIAGLCMVRHTNGATGCITVDAPQVDFASTPYGASFPPIGGELVQQRHLAGVTASPSRFNAKAGNAELTLTPDSFEGVAGNAGLSLTPDSFEGVAGNAGLSLTPDRFEARAGAAMAYLTPDGFVVQLSKGAAFTCVDPAGTGPAVNRVQFSPGVAGSGPKFQCTGTDANIPMEFGARGTGSFNFNTSFTLRQFAVLHTHGAVNYPTVTGAADGGECAIGVAGTGTTGHLALNARGTASTIRFNRPSRIWPCTFGTLPSASVFAGCSVRITDRGDRTATSDGTNWRYGGETNPIAT